MLHRGSKVIGESRDKSLLLPVLNIHETIPEPYYIKFLQRKMDMTEESLQHVLFLSTGPRTVEGFHCLYRDPLVSL